MKTKKLKFHGSWKTEKQASRNFGKERQPSDFEYCMLIVTAM
jgi:hypothetical protein